MTKEDLLSQLKGIHLPGAKPDWWVMAPGWYILDIAILILIVSAVVIYLHLKSKKVIRQKLLQKVDNIYQQNSNDCHGYAGNISILFKQAVLKSKDDKSHMTLHGDKWIEYLKQYAQDEDTIKLLIEASYNPKAKFDIDAVNQTVRSLYVKLIRS